MDPLSGAASVITVVQAAGKVCWKYYSDTLWASVKFVSILNRGRHWNSNQSTQLVAVIDALDDCDSKYDIQLIPKLLAQAKCLERPETPGFRKRYIRILCCTTSHPLQSTRTYPSSSGENCHL